MVMPSAVRQCGCFAPAPASGASRRPSHRKSRQEVFRKVVTECGITGRSRAALLNLAAAEPSGEF